MALWELLLAEMAQCHFLKSPAGCSRQKGTKRSPCLCPPAFSPFLWTNSGKNGQQTIFMSSAEAKKSRLWSGESTVGRSVRGGWGQVELAAPGWCRSNRRRPVRTGRVGAFMSHCRADFAVEGHWCPASQLIAHFPHSLKMPGSLRSLPACSLKVKHALAIQICPEPLNKCIQDIPRGWWERPSLTSLVGAYADAKAPWQYTSGVCCELMSVIYKKERKIGTYLNRWLEVCLVKKLWFTAHDGRF